MEFSRFLDGRRAEAKKLVDLLGKKFKYVAILGTDVKATLYMADLKSSNARDGSGECGFVVRMWNGRAYYEYSLDDIAGDTEKLAEKIAREAVPSDKVSDMEIKPSEPIDEPLVKSFIRERTEEDPQTVRELLPTNLLLRERARLNRGSAELRKPSRFRTYRKIRVSRSEIRKSLPRRVTTIRRVSTRNLLRKLR